MEVTLTVVEGPHQGKAFAFREHDSFIVGRGKEAHFRLPIDDKYFSRHHFLIEVNPPRCRLLDLGSTNGTRVNARKVRSADLNDGDSIKGGITTIRVAIKEFDTAFPSVTGTGDSDRFRPEQIQALASEEPPVPESEPVQAQSRGSTQGLAGSSPETKVPISSRVGVKTLAPTYSTWGTPRITTEASSCRVCGKSVPGAGSNWQASVCSECQDQIRRQDQPVAGYRIIRELGRGGMGVVYLALREESADLVALKTIIPEVAVSQKDIQRFFREADILRQLDHPHIVAFRDVGELSGRIYFAMDYVPGIDAARILRDNGGPLPIPRALGLVCQMLEALEYAHERKFVHRDIKPSNLLVKPVKAKDFALLTDFGLARVYQASKMSGLTMTGDLAGTPAYMAPEQITHFREATPATDLYAVGATLYNLLTGCCVFDLPRRLDLALLKILQEEPVPIDTRRTGVPPALAKIVHTSLAKDPRKRFATAGAMRDALLELRGKNRRG